MNAIDKKKGAIDSFYDYLPYNLKILKEIFGVASMEVRPNEDSMLYIKNDHQQSISLFLPLDAIVGRSALVNKSWDTGKQAFIREMVGKVGENVTLIDVGANIGLFTRQCLGQNPKISKVYCYEPNPLNYELLSRNLAGIGKAIVNNYGLSSTEGILDFYLDPNNAGNYSLNRNAVAKDHQTIKVEIRKAISEQNRWMNENDGLFVYKSDTQGYDELISTSLDIEFWSKVKCGIFELWRIPGKDYDVDKFAKVLDSFPRKIFESNPRQYVSTADVMKYLDGDDMAYDDLLFWR